MLTIKSLTDLLESKNNFSVVFSMFLLSSNLSNNICISSIGFKNQIKIVRHLKEKIFFYIENFCVKKYFLYLYLLKRLNIS